MSILKYQLKSETEDPLSLSLVKNENVGLVGSDAPASYISVSLDPMTEIKKEMKTEVEVCYESDGDMKYHGEDFTSAFRDEGGSLPIRKEVDKEKPFVCRECGKAFTWRSWLEQHSRIHNGERPYTCSDCGKSFYHKSNLKTHMAIHTGERAFACKDCGKSFSRKSHLESHMKIHIGEKPFACDECGKTFSRRNNLKQHFLTHTGKKPFRCSDCGKGFLQKSHLKAHMRKRPFTCKDCNTSFSLDPLMEVKTEVEVRYESDGDMKHRSEDFTS